MLASPAWRRVLSVWNIVLKAWTAIRTGDSVILYSSWLRMAKDVERDREYVRQGNAGLNAQINRLMRQNKEIVVAFRSKMDRKSRQQHYSQLQIENDILREEYRRVNEENRRLLDKDIDAS